MICIISAVVIYGVIYMRSPVETQRCEQITYEESVRTSAVFVREEYVYTADSAGTVFNHYADGDRVANGAVISTLYKGEVSEELLGELAVIDRKLAAANTWSSYGYSSDTQMESKIDEYRTQIVEAAAAKNAREVSDYRSKINNLRVGDSVTQEAEDIDALKAQNDAVEQKIGLDKTDIITNTSGVFTTVLDGLEGILTYENAKSFTTEDFERIKNVQGEQVKSRVSGGENICKVVNNHEWYVLMVMDNDDLGGRAFGDHVNLRFDNIPGEQIDGRIEFVNDNGDGTSMVMIRSAHYLEGAFSFRVSEATVIFESYTGYKVPVNALRSSSEGESCVLAEKDGFTQLYPVNIIYTDRNEDFVIVRTPEGAQKRLENADEIVIGENSEKTGTVSGG